MWDWRETTISDVRFGLSYLYIIGIDSFSYSFLRWTAWTTRLPSWLFRQVLSHCSFYHHMVAKIFLFSLSQLWCVELDPILNSCVPFPLLLLWTLKNPRARNDTRERTGEGDGREWWATIATKQNRTNANIFGVGFAPQVIIISAVADRLIMAHPQYTYNPPPQELVSSFFRLTNSFFVDFCK